MIAPTSPGSAPANFADLAPVLAPGGPPGLEALAAIQARYELTMDFGSIASLCERYGLDA
jgi:hypothetical protein